VEALVRSLAAHFSLHRKWCHHLKMTSCRRVGRGFYMVLSTHRSVRIFLVPFFKIFPTLDTCIV
jgi:hypothetical protein